MQQVVKFLQELAATLPWTRPLIKGSVDFMGSTPNYPEAEMAGRLLVTLMSLPLPKSSLAFGHVSVVHSEKD